MAFVFLSHDLKFQKHVRIITSSFLSKPTVAFIEEGDAAKLRWVFIKRIKLWLMYLVTVQKCWHLVILQFQWSVFFEVFSLILRPKKLMTNHIGGFFIVS